MKNNIAASSLLLALSFLATTLHAQSTTAPASTDLLTSEEVHTLVDAGQYKDALKALARILQLNGPAAAPYDRLDLVPLKAECQLQNHDSAGILLTLNAARKEALAANKPDNILLIDGFIELIQKSPAGLYTPKTAAIKTPLKILDRQERKKAYDALFADQFSLFQQKAKIALTSQTLPPYMDVAKSVAAVKPAEFCSIGSNAQTDAVIKNVAEHLLKFLTPAIADLANRHTRIKQAANRLITETVPIGIGATTYMEQQTHRQGLAPQDPNTLRQIADTCTKLVAAINELSAAFGIDPDSFKEQAAKCETLKNDITDTLNDDYATHVSGTTTPPSRYGPATH